MGGKLDIRWTGPYEIVEDLGKQRYKVKSQKTGKVLKSTVHCCRLKPYIKPATDIDEPEEDGEEDDEEDEIEEEEHEEVQRSRENIEAKQSRRKKKQSVAAQKLSAQKKRKLSIQDEQAPTIDLTSSDLLDNHVSDAVINGVWKQLGDVNLFDSDRY